MRAPARSLLLLAALAAAAGPAFSGRGATLLPSREFSFDGRRFVVEAPRRDGRSLVARELAQRGIDAGSVPRSLFRAVDAEGVESLREEPGDVEAPRLPSGLAPEHVLRLQSATGPVEIVFGRLDRGQQDILRQLRSSGWTCRDVDTAGAPGAIAERAGGKETSVVLLDRTEGRFLAIRRTDR